MIATIIGFLATIVGSRYGTAIANQRADAAARRIVLEIAHAQTEGRRTSAGRLIKINNNPVQVVIRYADDTALAEGNYKIQLGQEPYRVTDRTVDFNGDKRLIFDGFGRPDSGGTLTIRVGDVERTITVDAETGQATID